MDDLRTVLSQAIRAERSRQGLSQGELAERLGWTRTMLSKAERGDRVIGAHELPLICRVLGVRLGDLMRDADPQDRRDIGV